MYRFILYIHVVIHIFLIWKLDSLNGTESIVGIPSIHNVENSMICRVVAW